jgi:hypothetical protein
LVTRERTLVFCTAYADHHAWNQRYRRWLQAIRTSGVQYDQLLLVDDGSAVLPEWPDADIISDEMRLVSDAPVAFYHHARHLGRHDILDFPGWYRSFALAARWATVGGFTRVVHVESDAFLISDAAVNYVNGVQDAWIAMLCPRHQMPESAIQVMAGSGFARYAEYVAGAYEQLRHQSHELLIPFTHIEHGLIGDRYGEYQDFIPADADFAANAAEHAPASYFWWLDDDEFTTNFRKGTVRRSCLVSGWSQPEERFTWTLGTRSVLRLPRPLRRGDYVLAITCKPMTFGAARRFQRVSITVAGHAAGDFVVQEASDLEVPIPWSWMAGSEHLEVAFDLPDATAPADVTKQSTDRRALALGVFRMRFVPVS